MSRIKQFIIRAFWIVFSLSMLIIFICVLIRPLNNLIPWKMAVYTLVWTAVFGSVYIVALYAERHEAALKKIFSRMLPWYLVIFGAALYVVSYYLRSGPASDYENVYWAAYNMANGLEINNWDYFARWTNNVGYMLALAVLFKPVSFLKNQDISYYFVLFINVLQVVLMLRCIVYLAGKMSDAHSFKYSVTALLIGSIWLPVWANTSIFYSDQISLAAAIFGAAFLVKGNERKKPLLYSVPAGIMFAAGALIKITSATLIIAILIACLLFLKGRDYIKELAVIFIIFIVAFGGFKMYSSTLPYMDDVDVLKAPVEYWIALGLNGNGTYGDSEEFAVRCLMSDNYELRREIAREQINDSISNLWNADHIIAKIRQNFGTGDLGASRYLIWPENENLLWNFASSEGKYYWKYACLTTSFFFAWLFMSALGGICMCFKKSYEKKDMPVFTASLAFWGLALFLMLWEAQNKQMYNHSGIMIIMLVVSLNLLGEEVYRICRRKK